jgi:hypothetical protein
LSPPEVDACGHEIVDALVVSVVIVMIDECLDLRFQVCWEGVVLQQGAVCRVCLAPSLDVALRLRMLWPTPLTRLILVSPTLLRSSRGRYPTAVWARARHGAGRNPMPVRRGSAFR